MDLHGKLSLFEHVRIRFPLGLPRRRLHRAARTIRPDPLSERQKILTALLKVTHTPHAKGSPTKAQNSTVRKSEAACLAGPSATAGATAALLPAPAAGTLAVSSRRICHFGSTGRLSALQTRPTTSSPHSTCIGLL